MKEALIIEVQLEVDKGVPARSVPFDWYGQRYWIKISLKSQANNWHRVQNFFAGLVGVGMLRATVSNAGEEGLQDEVSRLKRVAERGVLVPDVVATRPGWILLSDIGNSLFDEIQNCTDKPKLLCNAACAFAKLHNAGGWHGTGQLRDLVLSPDQEIGFIDFEENVGEAMDVDAAQARDVLRFLISSVRFDEGDGKLLETILNTYRENAPAHVWPQMRAALKLMKPVAFLLKPFQKKLGRDLRHALLVYSALQKQI